MAKVCAVRKSKKYPDVYTVKELKDLAKEKGHAPSKVNKLKKEELCKLLKIKWVSSGTESEVKTTKDAKTKDSKKPNMKKDDQGKKYIPSSYKKPELVDIIVEKKGITKSKASKMTKADICDELNKLESTKKKSVKSKPSPQKVSPKEKSPKKDTGKKSGKIADCISRSKLKVKDHQRVINEHLHKNRGIIAAFDTGTGKTLTAVVAGECYLDENKSGKVIVVTPKSLQENFAKEYRNYGGKRFDKYEIITTRSFAIKYSKGCPKGNYMLIIDEAHQLRTDLKAAGKKAAAVKSEGKKTPVCNAKVAVECCKKAKRVLLLTATPIYNAPSDILNLAAMVKGEDPLSENKFLRMSPSELCKYFQNTIMFFSTGKSSKDYPTSKEHNIKIVMNEKYYKNYRDVEKQNNPFYKETNPYIFLTGIRQSTNNLKPYLKLKWVMKKVEENHKTVIYSAFLNAGVNLLKKKLEDKGIKYKEITGSLSEKKRIEAVDMYNRNKVKVILITAAGGMGLDLKGTKNIILLEKSWNDSTEEQVIGRGIRYKSHSHLPPDQRHVDVYHMMLVKPKKLDEDDDKPSADEMLDTLIKKKTKVNQVFIKMLKSTDINSPGKCPIKVDTSIKPSKKTKKKTKKKKKTETESKPKSKPKSTKSKKK